jgi:hypothetical protein
MKHLKLFENFDDNEPVIKTLETILSLVKSNKRLSSKLNGGTVMDLHDRCSDPQVMEILMNAVDVISHEIEGTTVKASDFIDTDELEGLIRILKANPEKSESGMKLEKFSKFIKESHTKSVHISDDEMNLFSDESALQELITKNKITLKNKEVLFDENDEETRQLLDQYLEMPGKVEESIFARRTGTIYDLFGEFYRAKNNYSDEIQKIINKVASLEKTENNVRYLNELHKYYEVLNYVPANLMQNIELKRK